MRRMIGFMVRIKKRERIERENMKMVIVLEQEKQGKKGQLKSDGN